MNLQERINENLQRLESELQKRREEEEKVKSVIERRINSAFGLLESLQVYQVLDEVRRDVWRDGKLEPFERVSEGRFKPKKTHGMYSYEGKQVIRGFSLAYDYQIPQMDFEDITRQRFGFYKKPWYWGGGFDSPPQFAGTVTKFGTHQEHIGRRPVLHWHEMKQQLSVFIEQVKYYTTPSNYDPNEFSFTFHGNNSIAMMHSGTRLLDYDRIDVSAIKNLLDQLLLDDCSQRTRSRLLPYQIKEDIPKRLAEVETRVRNWHP